MQKRSSEWMRWGALTVGPMLVLGLAWSVGNSAPVKGKTPEAKHTSCCAPAAPAKSPAATVQKGKAGTPAPKAGATSKPAPGSNAAGTYPMHAAKGAKPAPSGQPDQKAPGAKGGSTAAPSKAKPGATAKPDGPQHPEGCPMHPKP